MEQIFSITGQIVWAAICIVVSFLFAAWFYEKVIKNFWYAIVNLKFAIFGSKRRNLEYIKIWQNGFAHKSGVREHWKSWRLFRRLAYIRLLREVKKELHTK